MSSLIGLPAIVVLVVAIAVAVGIACGLQEIVRRRYGEAEVEHNEIAGHMLGVVGTLYAVVLGFMTVVVWQQYDATIERVALETASVADVWHSAVALPPAQRTELRKQMLAYAKTNEDDDWPLMRVGKSNPLGDVLIMNATGVAGTFVPKNEAQSNAQQSLMRMLADLHDARQRRQVANTLRFSWFEWLMLDVGALVVLGICTLFRVGNVTVHRVMTSAVAVMIATMFVLIFELQFPFRSDMRIPAARWTALIEHIQSMDAGAQTNMRM